MQKVPGNPLRRGLKLKGLTAFADYKVNTQNSTVLTH